MRNPKESFPLFIPEYYPSEITYQILSITKDMHLQGGIKKGKAAFSCWTNQKNGGRKSDKHDLIIK